MMCSAGSYGGAAAFMNFDGAYTVTVTGSTFLGNTAGNSTVYGNAVSLDLGDLDPYDILSQCGSIHIHTYPYISIHIYVML